MCNLFCNIAENESNSDFVHFNTHESNLSFNKLGRCRLQKVVAKSRKKFSF